MKFIDRKDVKLWHQKALEKAKDKSFKTRALKRWKKQTT
jgi:hypothetical protein